MAKQTDAQQMLDELGQLREEVERLSSLLERLGSGLVRPHIRTDHPHVIRIEGVHGGRPTIRGTGVSVQTIVEQARLGRLPDQIWEDFDGVLTLAQVYDALSYYHEHPNEIEQYITENQAALWKGPSTGTTRQP
jgi:uncharacterized protein (DUF433 family)